MGIAIFMLVIAVIAVIIGVAMFFKKEHAAAKLCMIAAFICAALALFAHCANQISEKTEQHHHERKDF